MRENFFSIQATMAINGKNINGTVKFDTEGVTFFSKSTTLFYTKVNWKDITIELSEERVQTFLFFSKEIINLVLRENQSTVLSVSFSKDLKYDVFNKLNQICRDAKERYTTAVSKVEEEHQRELEEEHQRKLEEERQRRLEEERQRKFEEECRRKQEEERQRKLEEERQHKLEEERQRKFEEERQRKLEEERQRRLEEENQRRLEEEHQRKLEERLRWILEEILKRKIEEERLRMLEEDNQRKLEEEHQRRLEEEKQRKREEERQRKLKEERNRKSDKEWLRELKATQRHEIKTVYQQKQVEKQHHKLEEKRQLELEKERQRKLDEERQRKIEEEHQRRLEEENQRKLEEERQQRIEADLKRRHKTEQNRKEEEKDRHNNKREQTFLSKQEDQTCVATQKLLGHAEDDQYGNSTTKDMLEYHECSEFQCFADRFVYDCRDARVEILSDYLLTFLTDYCDTSNGKSSKTDLADKCSELIMTLNQMEAGFEYESTIEDAVADAIRADYYDPSALRQALENILIDYHYKLRLSSGIYLQAYSDSYGLRSVREHNAYYIEKGDAYASTILNEIIEDTERKALYSHLASVREDQVEQIRSFIERQKKPVSKAFLKVKFDEFSSATINNALNCPDILHYGKHVLSANNLNISIPEKKKLKVSIRKAVNDTGSIIHVKALYDRIYLEYYDLFMRLFIDNELHLFSVINFLYSTEFSFKNPYLARKGTDIPSPEDRLRQYAFKKEELDIDDYLSYSRDNYIKIAGILNSINLLNSKMLLKNRTRLISIDKAGISPAIVKTVESLICKELDDEEVVALRDLNCIPKFPVINIPWDEWFLYSVLNKWGDKLFLYTTASQFRSSIPAVSKNSFVTADDLQIIANKHAGDTDRVLNSSIDDLDNLDELIEESIELNDIDDLDDFEVNFSDYNEELYQ